MDIRRNLRLVISTGKVHIGTKQTIKALKEKKCKLVIYCNNTSTPQEEILAKYEKTPKYKFDGNNFELGAACGKPFPISVISVINPGNSDILALGK